MARALPAESEAAFQIKVVNLALFCGWRHYHPPDNRPTRARSGRVYVQDVKAGWPDLALVRPPESLFVELKTDKGRVDPAQREWLDLLAACGHEVHVWRPRDWDTIERRLRRIGP